MLLAKDSARVFGNAPSTISSTMAPHGQMKCMSIDIERPNVEVRPPDTLSEVERNCSAGMTGYVSLWLITSKKNERTYGDENMLHKLPQ